MLRVSLFFSFFKYT